MTMQSTTETTAVPFVRGSETSEEAAEAKKPTALSDEKIVFLYIEERGAAGATDDEVERALSYSHQNASARRNSLVRKGLVQDSGTTRPTRTGRRATVWTVGEGKPLEGAPNDRVKRPSKEALRHASDIVQASSACPDVVAWLRWIARH